MLKRYAPLVIGLFFLFLLAGPHGAQAKADAKPAETVSIPADATAQQVKDIMAGLTDAQVRRLLLDELKKETPAPSVEPKPVGLAGVVKDMKSGAAFVRHRFEYLFSGAASAPRELPSAVKRIVGGDERMPPGRLFLAIGILTVLWLAAMYVFKRKTTTARKAISRTPQHAAWYTRMWRLFLRALLDLFGIVLSTVAIFICYLSFFNGGAASKPVILAWLGAMVFLALVKLVSRFLLAPHAPTLRYLPLSDAVAQYLFKWLVWLARIVATGLLVTSLLRLEGGSEAISLLVSAFFGFLVAFTISLLALWNKKQVAEYIRTRNDPESLIYSLADGWHVGAIIYVLGFWVFWLFALMIFGTSAMLSGVLTLIIVPGYLLADWLTQRLVTFAVDLAASNTPDKAGGDSGNGGVEAAEPSINKFQRLLSKGFRVLVFVASVFLLMRIWGIDFTLGRETVRAALNTLVTLVLAYIFWIFISSFIERKIMDKQGAEEHSDSGEGGGGPGGDRFSTLLQLVKKFIFAAVTVVTVLIILSSLGVDIGPLIAGASVFGIAIGFGAQTLVKDIISGIFFLMDDAFRVGDYIIVGSARGSVEEISVRSFKLRHHLGSIYTIPFGSIKEIQNMTRDWAIMKLQYLVPFDTDIQQVKKIIKKINKEIRAVPELNDFMLDDIKSQGVKAMEEYGMRMRVKFMTKPGGQFTLRKLVLAKMRKEFAEAGIEFAKPRVSVHLPDQTDLSPEEAASVAAAASKAIEKKESKGGSK